MERISDSRYEASDRIGFIEMTDYMGSDYSILSAARVSTKSISKGDKRDKGLIEYLYIHQHESPIEMPVFQFHIKAPIFVSNQIVRHRTQSMNQLSARYSEMDDSFFIPTEYREQDKKNRQSSNVTEAMTTKESSLDQKVSDAYLEAYKSYKDLIEEGVAKEQARIVLPMGIYTEWFFQMNLRNLFHFLELRTHPHAQFETREYAVAIHEMLKSMDEFKWIVDIFSKVLPLKWLFTDALATKKFDELTETLSFFLKEGETDDKTEIR